MMDMNNDYGVVEVMSSVVSVMIVLSIVSAIMLWGGSLIWRKSRVGRYLKTPIVS